MPVIRQVTYCTASKIVSPPELSHGLSLAFWLSSTHTQNASFCIQFANIACATRLSKSPGERRESANRFFKVGREMNYYYIPSECVLLHWARFNDFLIFFCWNYTHTLCSDLIRFSIVIFLGKSAQ